MKINPWNFEQPFYGGDFGDMGLQTPHPVLPSDYFILN
jgi:hypothetical protein